MIIKEGSPSTFGWVRRKDLEGDAGNAAHHAGRGCKVFELPDGKLYVFPPGVKPVVMRACGLPFVPDKVVKQ